MNLLALSAVFSSVCIAIRWTTYGQGPFLTLYEVLLSNLFSLTLLGYVVLGLLPALREGLFFSTLSLSLLAVWTLSVDRHVMPLPPTFSNYWLWAHVAFGKLFLCFIWYCAGYSGSCLVRGKAAQFNKFAVQWSIYWALLFHSAMILAGMAWALEAWGHFWGWDGVEVWSLIIWLLLVTMIHLDKAYVFPPVPQLCCVLLVFGLAVVTFFGIPFLSVAPHKGVF